MAIDIPPAKKALKFSRNQGHQFRIDVQVIVAGYSFS